MKNLFDIVSNFKLEGVVREITPLGEGFINDTFNVITEGAGDDYILQRKNHQIFTDVPSMMQNIEFVVNHLKMKIAGRGGDPLREALTLTYTNGGALYYNDEEGNYWTMCIRISNSVTYDVAETLDQCYNAGKCIGQFQADLSDFDTPLNETIKGFHNLRWRFEQWDKTIAADRVGRVADVRDEIEWIESRRAEMLNFWSLVESGEIPTSVTHNDTKLSNVLFDATGDVLCMIDLDTVMSNTSLADIGDAIRSYTNRGAEDDKNLDNVFMDISRYEAYINGYLSQRKNNLSALEMEWLAFSGRYITVEQVLRFLMDYIDGDNYYKTHYEGHNLVRTHAQYKLLQSIEEQYDKMREIILKF